MIERSVESKLASAAEDLVQKASAKFPNKKEIIMKQAEQIGLNRVIGGVHHPSDIQAGQYMAQQLWEKIKNSPFLLSLLTRE
jgi:hypothetical protein